jgi:FkbH-like protein
MHWLPPAPTDFKERLRAARTLVDPRQRWQNLVRLSCTRLGYLDAIQLDRAVTGDAELRAAGDPAVRIALLGAFTLEHLVPFVRVAALRHGLNLEVYTGAYGQYRAELTDPGSALHGFRPDVVLLSIDVREAVAGVALDATADVAESALDAFVDQLRDLWQAARDSLGAAVVQQTALDTFEPLFGSHDRIVAGAPFRLVERLNHKLADAAAMERVALLDIARAAARDGLDAWFDAPRWLQAKMEIAPQAGPTFGELLARVVGALRGRSRKCLVLDLDNTVWGGVVGDLGVEGLVLGAGSAAGEAFAGVQRYAKRLAERGIILAVCSKNEASVAEAAFRDHPEMVLRRADIAAFVANWDDKAVNLRRIAEQLNIGLDSLVFVDDNPAERARVRDSLPAVAVPELPTDPAGYVRCVAEAGYFEAVAFTVEDRRRAGQYAANTEREALRGASQSMDEFLRGLGMSTVFGPVQPVDVQRVAQLLNKTNQFNTTMRRYTAQEVGAIAADPEYLALQFRLLDRFGDNGLVSVMLLRTCADACDELEIENWVMSCRVFGRELEVEALNIAAESARARGVRALRASYQPTDRNAVVRTLYPSLGFAPLGATPVGPGDPGASRWILPLAGHVARPTHIRRMERTT